MRLTFGLSLCSGYGHIDWHGEQVNQEVPAKLTQLLSIFFADAIKVMHAVIAGQADTVSPVFKVIGNQSGVEKGVDFGGQPAFDFRTMASQSNLQSLAKGKCCAIAANGLSMSGVIPALRVQVDALIRPVLLNVWLWSTRKDSEAPCEDPLQRDLSSVNQIPSALNDFANHNDGQTALSAAQGYRAQPRWFVVVQKITSPRGKVAILCKAVRAIVCKGNSHE